MPPSSGASFFILPLLLGVFSLKQKKKKKTLREQERRGSQRQGRPASPPARGALYQMMGRGWDGAAASLLCGSGRPAWSVCSPAPVSQERPTLWRGCSLQTVGSAPVLTRPFPISCCIQPPWLVGGSACCLLPDRSPALPLFSVLQEATFPRLPCQVASRWLSVMGEAGGRLEYWNGENRGVPPLLLCPCGTFSSGCLSSVAPMHKGQPSCGPHSCKTALLSTWPAPTVSPCPGPASASQH